MTPSVLQRIVEFHEQNAQVAQRIKDKSSRIDHHLALASGIDVLFGDIAIQGQYFGQESRYDTD